MPLEIRELHIKLNIEGDANSTPGGSGNQQGEDSQAMIKTIVDKVLEILKDKAER